jgi:hypothetical protein
MTGARISQISARSSVVAARICIVRITCRGRGSIKRAAISTATRSGRLRGIANLS